MAANRSFVELRDVTLRYGEDDALALDRTSLSIREGEFIAVVGPSGCGKSTLLKLVSGLHPPNSGSVFVEGREVTQPLKITGMAFQNATLLPWRSTLKNVLLPMEVSEAHRRQFRRNKAEYVERAMALLDSVGLAGYAESHPWELSGGMQQRASLCRALIHQPRLLLLDEPFAALDAFTREELWAILQELWTVQKFTCILVTHDLREAAYLADTIYVMSKRPGRILAVRENNLARPRNLETTFQPDFVDLVHELREHISDVRQDRGIAAAQPEEVAP